MGILRKYWHIWTGAAVLTSIVVAAALELVEHPTSRAAEDMSCHNAFRHTSATVIAPKLYTELNINEDEWPALTALLHEFARTRGWSFRDGSVQIPGKVNTINLDLCTDDWQMILVAENLWKGSHAYDGMGPPMALYADVEPRQWHQTARSLVRILEKKWPDRVRFRDKDGRLTEPPGFLGQGESQH